MYVYQMNLRLISEGEVMEANSNLSSCINFTVFSFVMAYNNKNVGGLFGCKKKWEILRKSWQVFHDRSFNLRSFWSFVMPVLEYC